MAEGSLFDASTSRALADRNGDPAWLAERRLEALRRFDALDWPDPKAEAWRYSSLKGLDLADYSPLAGVASSEGADGLPEEVRSVAGAIGDRDGLAIQVDGDVVSLRLEEDLASKGVIFAPLSRAAADYPELVGDVLASAGTSASDEKLVALASAFGSGGSFVYVPRGVEVSRPLQSLRWISGPGVAVCPRTVIVAEEGAAVTYIDHYRSGPLDGPSLSVGTVEIHAHAASNVGYLSVQDWASTAWHFNVQRAVVARDATLRSLAATLGGRFSRSLVESILDGPGAYSEMLGVYFGDGTQHFDHRSLQEHRAPHSKSELYYKGALKGHASAVYSGLIHIAKEAQKTDSWQGNRNLILSDHAKADSIPYLEIEANDVRCAHGASVGPPEEDVLFYLQSRGLDEAEAERLVVKGFFQEVLDRVRVGEIRAALEAAVEAELAREE